MLSEISFLHPPVQALIRSTVVTFAIAAFVHIF